MKHFLVLFFASFLFISVDAQKDETLFGCRGLGLTGVWGGTHHSLDQFKPGDNLNEGGYFIFEFGKDFTIGWDNFSSEGDMETGELVEMDSRGLHIGYAPFSNKRVHPYFQIYGGKADLTIDDVDQKNIFVTQPAIGVELNIFRWLRVGADFGYRFASDTSVNGFTDEDFSSPYAGLKLKFGWSWGR